MSSVRVSNIAPSTTEQEVRDFFSYCGKIISISMTPTSGSENATHSATITFERQSACATSLLLDNTQLGENAVKVESTASLDELSHGHGDTEESEELRQEDKPRTAILSEYLSHGYVIGDKAIQRGIDLDNKHGISTKFHGYLKSFADKYHPVDTARSVDSTYAISDKATQGYNVLNRYFESALGTPTGQKVRDFYMQGQKQVFDIHNEARRLADLRQGNAPGEGSSSDLKPSMPGGTGVGASHSVPAAGQLVSVGDGKTICSCAGNEGVCQCAPGTCACEPCSKNQETATIAS